MKTYNQLPPFPPELQAHESSFRATLKTYIELTATLSDGTYDPLGSRFGGDVYLPKDMPYPEDSYGQPLFMVAQINFAELPPLDPFPKAGILQWFVRATSGMDSGMMGIDFDDYTNQSDFRVIFHTNLTPEMSVFQIDDRVDIWHEYSNRKNKSYLDITSLDTPLQPPQAVWNISGAFGQMYLDASNLNFYEWIEQIDPNQEFADFWHSFISIDNRYDSGHRIGGYPFFPRYSDIRDDERYDDYILLFQIGNETSEFGESTIDWGVCGNGYLFIREEDLLRLDFTKVAYFWQW